MVFNTVRTIYTVRLQTFMLCNLPYKPLPNTTVNEKLDILSHIDPTGYPKLNLITIGVGGDTTINNNIRELRRSWHSAKDGVLFKYLPFIIREADKDLTAEEKRKFRLRRIEIINNKEYACYYGLVIDSFKYENLLFKVNSSVEDNFIRVYRTENDPTILNPTPVTNTDLLNAKGEYALNMCKVPLIITLDLFNELRNSLKIKYPNDNVDMISEIGLCTSEDYQDENGNIEAISVETAYFVDVGIDLQATESYQKDLELYLEIGGMEPLIK